jgi:hypothetical protein
MSDSKRNVRGEAKSIVENRFFADLEDMIFDRLHSEVETEQGHAELIRSTGIQDNQLIAELVDLGITAEGLVALRLLPLVLVAWAENGVDPQERLRVMSEASRLGIQDGSVADVLLHEWLRKRPLGESVDAWKRFMHGVFEKMSEAGQNKLIDATEQQMTAVAKASGGHLGIGKVSTKEQQMIAGLVLALRKQTKKGTER